ncbi:MAG: hypothetical protein DI598_16585 [Pseudopedobacter saltans]|uniref:WbqC-like family protein n=1 Tax=Pseudopedobacter saltans TaxID=151895 RepID=A0A2W5ELA3_9SPHI|nr:MAG: hypothetical protein DI598_16585 [Pseudopedobacter saltans]
MLENDTLLVENHYFTSVYLFKNSIDKTYIKISPCESYKKMSFKNRCMLVGSNGLISLSVPIENGRDQKVAFKDVRISSSQPWQKVHWRTISSCYGKSPFWEYYADYFAPLFEKNFEFLWDLNTEILQLLWRLIDKKMKIVIEDQQVSAVSSLGYDFLPKNYAEKPNPVIYGQLFEDRIGFKPNVSILDLLCMEGPNTGSKLKEFIVS